MPLAIRLGHRFGMVSKPRLFGASERTVPTVGGIAIAVAVFVGFTAVWGVPVGVGALALGALIAKGLGLADDRFTQLASRPVHRLLLQVGLATGAVFAGLRADQGGIVGALGTILFLVACMNAMNLLDNMDGVAGSTGAGVAAGITILGLTNGQFMVASLAAAVCGACLGFLVFNFNNARVYLGNGGSLFLGFILGGAALLLRLPLGDPFGLVALAAIMAVPITDTAVIMTSRFMYGRSVMQGGTDHISHRLVRCGFKTREAALLHGGAALLGTSVVAMAVTTGSKTVMLATLAIFAAGGLALLKVPVYEDTRPSRRRMALVGAAVLGSLLMVLAVPATSFATFN